MGKYEILIKPSAVKELETIRTKKDRQKIVSSIRKLSIDPRPHGCKKLSGRDKFRIRVGVYRIVYAIEDARLVVFIVKVGHRKDVYR